MGSAYLERCSTVVKPSAPRTAPPRLTKGMVERVRLLDRLAEGRHKTCVLLVGPAGCGKTTLALQWRAQLLGYGFDFAWMTVPAGEDSESLLDTLFASFDRVDPGIAREAAFTQNREAGDGSAEAIAIALLNGLARHPRDIVLLIDDYQNVVDTRADQLLQVLLDFAPTHFHLAIATRSTPRVSLSRLRDRGALLELGFRDLRFSFAEAEEFLRAQRADLPRRDARILYDLTDGWVAGLRLVSLDLKRKPSRTSDAEPVQNAQEFAAYLEQEVLSQLSPAELDALTQLAAPRRFNDALAAALFGAAEGQRLMDRLRRDNLFLLPDEGAERDGFHRFHPLFHDLLKERFDALPAERRQRTHALLGEWFGARRLLREAVQHCVAAGEIERAAEWVERHAKHMFLAGQLRRVARAVTELPRAAVNARVSLRLWVAWSHLCYHRLPQCHASVNALAATLPPGDGEARHHLTLLEGSLAIQDDDTAAAERLLPRLEAMAAVTDAILAGGRRNILGWLYLHLGQYERARATLTAPRPLLEDGTPLLDSAFGALTSQCLAGYSFFLEGDMRAAERTLRDALAESERTLGALCEPACNAAGLLSAVLYEIDDVPGLRSLLEPRFDVIERVAIPDSWVCAAVIRSRLHRLDGDTQEALAVLERLEDQAQRRGLDRVLAFALKERVHLHLQRREIAAAEEAVAQLRFVAKRQEHSTAASRRVIESLAAFARVWWLAADGRITEAHAQLTELIRNRPMAGPGRRETQWVAKLALLDARLGNHDAARRRVAEALVMARRFGLLRSILDLDNAWLGLAEDARTAGLLDATTCFYLEHLKAHAGTGRAAPMAAPAPTQELSEREVEILRALATAMPNKRIAQALGLSPETVKWHLKNVYSKLGVYGRDGAIARARHLGLIDASP
ncbi:MAG TPA: LuxR C-terminal-related transcriptional regulator [Burkholderiaceae bacterium]|nr:LuxR C-terminal-related transcriptional regulator [Burkholderiaceae bacterium]